MGHCELRKYVSLLGGFLLLCSLVYAQQSAPATDATNEAGKTEIDGRATPYMIRRLPVSSFPELPGPIATYLSQTGCLIPQTYQAHRPENVIHASLERPGSWDWAVLCSKDGTVSLLAFITGSHAAFWTVASAPEVLRMQVHDASGIAGFDWGIDAATPEQVRQAQAGMANRPPPVNHDALMDTIIDHRTVYHFYSKGRWDVLDMPDN